MICNKCKQQTELTLDFYYPSQLKDGSKSWCKFCLVNHKRENRHLFRDRDRAYAKEYNKTEKGKINQITYWERRRLKINTIKENSPCADCNQFYPAICMDFDHLDVTTKIDDVATLVGNKRPWSIIEKEIAKCELVCANCHRIRTRDRRDKVKSCH